MERIAVTSEPYEPRLGDLVQVIYDPPFSSDDPVYYRIVSLSYLKKRYDLTAFRVPKSFPYILVEKVDEFGAPLKELYYDKGYGYDFLETARRQYRLIRRGANGFIKALRIFNELYA